MPLKVNQVRKFFCLTLATLTNQQKSVFLKMVSFKITFHQCFETFLFNPLLPRGAFLYHQKTSENESYSDILSGV